MREAFAVKNITSGSRRRVTEMSDREYIAFKKRREAVYRRRRAVVSFAAVLFMIVSLSLAIKTISANAASAEKNSKCKYYKTCMIKYDKGLDDIAAEAFDPAYYNSVDDVRKEIAEINHLSADSAIPGGLIIYVPYYGDIH